MLCLIDIEIPTGSEIPVSQINTYQSPYVSRHIKRHLLAVYRHIGFDHARLPAASIIVSLIQELLWQRPKDTEALVMEDPWVTDVALPWAWTITVETALQQTYSALSSTSIP